MAMAMELESRRSRLRAMAMALKSRRSRLTPRLREGR
jgi:hypothetical protein